MALPIITDIAAVAKRRRKERCADESCYESLVDVDVSYLPKVPKVARVAKLACCKRKDRGSQEDDNGCSRKPNTLTTKRDSQRCSRCVDDWF